MTQNNIENMLGEEIGRGGYGVVHIKKDDPSLCIKVSNKKKGSDSCRQWSNEFEKIRKFTARIKHHPAFSKCKSVRVLEPVEFHESTSLCYMILPRIYRPEGTNSRDPTIQAQLGWESIRMVHKGRGEFIGLKEIKEYIKNERELRQACFELGVVMALIHHVGRNDAYDVELYIGREARSRKVRFYLADFDLSQEVSAFDAETIKRLTWSMDAVPYFPRKSCDPELFQVFYAGYLSVAQDEDLVQRIFKTYD